MKEHKSIWRKTVVCSLVLAAATMIPAVWGQERSGNCDFQFGDINEDGAVNLLDSLPFESLLLNDCQYLCQADHDQNGTVDLLDYSEFIKVLGGAGVVK